MPAARDKSDPIKFYIIKLFSKTKQMYTEVSYIVTVIIPVSI